jgi:hypothetical protein
MRSRAVVLGVISALVILALLMQGLGGWLNMTGQDSAMFQITSQHAWNDGLFVLGLAILLAILYIK